MVIWREFREAWRRLSRRPGYALLSIVMLGVGLGVAMCFFGAVNDVVLEPYPFPHADRLMAVGEPFLMDGGGLNGIGNMDSDQYLALDGRLASFDCMGALKIVGLSMDQGQGGVYRYGAMATASAMAMLGARPLLGRLLQPADDQPGAARVMVLSESLWRDAFAADPKIVGRQVRVSGRWYTVVGVARRSFEFPPNAEFWLPLVLQPGEHASVFVIARLKPGIGLAQARAELAAWDGRLAALLPLHARAEPLVVGPLSLAFSPNELRHWLWMMFGAGLLVLLLAAFDVANLEWVKTRRRQHELALRSALGASRLRLLLGPLVESWLIGIAALALAFAVAAGCRAWLMATWVSIYPNSMPYLHGLFNGSMLAFAVAVAFITTSLASGLPAWRASRPGIEAALRDEGKGTGRAFVRVMRVLVVAEVVLTVVLLVGAGTFVRALHRLLAVPDVGATHAAHVLTADVDLPTTAYRQDAKRIRFFQQVVQQLGQDAGVVAATATNIVPGAFLGNVENVSLPGHGEPNDGWPQVQMGIVDPHFLDTFGVRLLQGRFFDARDTTSSEPVVVIDARMAAAFWPHQNALDRQLVLDPGSPQARTVTVVGVVQTLEFNGPLTTPMPNVLIPLAQSSGQGMWLAVRVHGDAMVFLPRLVAAIHGVDSQVAVSRTLTQARNIADTRVGMVVLSDAFTALGLVALLLAAAGLYGVLAFSVAQRTREIGIRRAIGAGNEAIVRMVGRQLIWQLGSGLVIGFVLAVPWSDLLAADPGLQLRAHDPLVFASVLLLVLGVSVLAALVPLRRALRVDPAVALRYE